MKKIFTVGITMSILIVLMSGCKKNDKLPVSALKNDINVVTNPTLGQYLTNKDGLTLYMFANDADGISTCTGGCEALWPAFTANIATATLDSKLTATDFATITTASGKKQVTYKGWPLYTYSPSTDNGYGNAVNIPEAAGSTRGDGLTGVWFVAKPDYTIMLANKQLTGLDGNTYKSDYTIGLGKTVYFTDGIGKTIYTFTADSFNVNKFTKADFSNNGVFPIYEQEKIIVPSILDKALFGTITVATRKQMTYRGWPLYHFGQDTLRGSNKAVSVPAKGVWPVAVKDVTEARK